MNGLEVSGIILGCYEFVWGVVNWNEWFDGEWVVARSFGWYWVVVDNSKVIVNSYGLL